MKKLLIATTLLSLASNSYAQNLLTNGDFEANAGFTDRTGFPRLDDVNGSFPTGWTRDPSPLANYLSAAPLGGDVIYNASSGDWSIGTNSAAEYWEQTFATTPGTAYNLTFDLGNSAPWSDGTVLAAGYLTGGNSMDVLIDGVSIGTFTNSNAQASGTTLIPNQTTWEAQSATFTAATASTTLRFTNGLAAIDNASVTLVPEPSSILLSGIAALGLLARRKRA